MLRTNSPTLQNMINSVKPGEGNMNIAAPVIQGQFQTPYPSPKDMVMQAGMMGYQQPMNPIMPGFQIPGNTVTMINGVPTELEFKPHEVGTPNLATESYTNIPGAPSNPNLVPQPGRYMVPNNNNSMYGQARTSMLGGQPNIVGAYKPYVGSMSYNPQFQQNIPQSQTYGVVNMYNGSPVHPHINETWYGSPDYPFENISKKSVQNNLSDIMRDRFNQKFPGYNNPYMTPGFMQPNNITISPEVQDMANIAAFYGMSYEQFVKNGSDMMKLMSRHASKYLGHSEEESVIRQKTYDIKPETKPGNVPDNDEDLFYPNGAFDFRGQLTREFQGLFCVNKTRLEKAKKTLKVSVAIGDKIIECKKRPMEFSITRDHMDRWIISDNNYHMWLYNNKFRFASMYWSAPERKIDHIEGNVFQVAGKTIGFAEQRELEMRLQQQRYTMTANMFNRDEFITKIKAIRENNKIRAKAIDDEKFRQIVHKVAGPKPGQEIKIPAYQDKPYICDGDWIIAKPGVDIVGLPLEQSVNKIIRMNTATGEEEIYDPTKMTGLDVRERIIASMQPSFDKIDDNELSNRLERFENAGFLNSTD